MIREMNRTYWKAIIKRWFKEIQVYGENECQFGEHFPLALGKIGSRWIMGTRESNKNSESSLCTIVVRVTDGMVGREMLLPCMHGSSGLTGRALIIDDDDCMILFDENGFDFIPWEQVIRIETMAR